jgi:flagellar basal-body rod protein FlgF
MANNIEAVSSSLEALQQRYTAITNNLANSSTVAYKRQVGQFQQVLAGQLGAAQAGATQGQGKVLGHTGVDFTQGPIAQTSRPLDLAISGNGFFVVETPQGNIYTRNGTFSVNAQSQLVDSAGRLVAGDNGPIVVPKNTAFSQINVTADGAVTAEGKTVGKLKIVDFPDKTALVPLGASSFTAPATAEAVPATSFQIKQGYQESSNVNVVSELVNLITVSRAYEANSKSISGQDDRLKSLMQVAMS